MGSNEAAMTWPGRQLATKDDDHFFRVEVTVAACIATPDNRALGDNQVDVTFGFSMSAARPPRDMSDAEVNAALSRNISPVAAAIVTTLTSIGFAFIGQIDEPMTEHSTPTGEFGHSTPVKVTVSMPTDPARA